MKETIKYRESSKYIPSLGIISAVVLSSLLIAFTTVYGGVAGGVALVGGLVLIPVLYKIIVDTNFGLIAVLVISFLVQYFAKFSAFPAGVLLDALSGLLVFVVILKEFRHQGWNKYAHPITAIVIVWMFYGLLQGLNPVAESFKAWIYTVRSMSILFILYFVSIYAFTSLKRIISIFKLVIIFTFLAALYGIKQEFIGFSDAEIAWLYADDLRFQLIVQWGRFRVFSIFSDPTTFGVLMAIVSTFSLVMAMGPMKMYKKIGLVFMAITMIISMGYGGSRTPVLLIPIGAFLYLLMTLNKKVLFGALFLFGIGFVVIMKNTSNPILFRIRSAFMMSESASVDVRMQSQKLIQPYIHSHPFGFGLGSTGQWARRFTPDSWLANFAHDSGYVRIAVEMGWIALILYMMLLFMVIKSSVKYYLLAEDPVVKTLYLGFSVVLFMLIIASYPQEVIILLPTAIIFYLILGAIVRLKDFDR